jgi:hypothetical protein
VTCPHLSVCVLTCALAAGGENLSQGPSSGGVRSALLAVVKELCAPRSPRSRLLFVGCTCPTPKASHPITALFKCLPVTCVTPFPAPNLRPHRPWWGERNVRAWYTMNTPECKSIYGGVSDWSPGQAVAMGSGGIHVLVPTHTTQSEGLTTTVGPGLGHVTIVTPTSPLVTAPGMRPL